MRITNKMMSGNSLANINTNKEYLDKLNNQMATEKKITRPSDDPIVAIRALRLRSNLSEITQYYGAVGIKCVSTSGGKCVRTFEFYTYPLHLHVNTAFVGGHGYILEYQALVSAVVADGTGGLAGGVDVVFVEVGDLHAAYPNIVGVGQRSSHEGSCHHEQKGSKKSLHISWF